MVKRLAFSFSCIFMISCGTQEPVATQYKKRQSIQQAAVGDSNSGDAVALTIDWEEPIYSARFGLEPNPNVDGKTLAEIISSADFGRDDGLKCSACHNSTEAAGGYGVDAEVNAASPEMKPTDVVYGKAWVGEDGWAVGFIQNKTKPANIQAVIEAWKNGGFQ